MIERVLNFFFPKRLDADNGGPVGPWHVRGLEAALSETEESCCGGSCPDDNPPTLEDRVKTLEGQVRSLSNELQQLQARIGILEADKKLAEHNATLSDFWGK